MASNKITKISTIIDFLNNIFPQKNAEKWDNCQIINTKLISRPVKAISIGLDFLCAHLEELAQTETNLIITHHPLWIKKEDIDGGVKLIKKFLVDHNIVFVPLHTQFDINTRGTNYQLIKKLDLFDMDTIINDSGLTYATLKQELTPNELIGELRLRLKLELCKFHLQTKIEKVTKVVFCAGSGYDLAPKVKWDDAQIFITGDLKYHDWVSVERNNYNVIDMGHGVEKIFEIYLKSLIESNFDIKVNCLSTKSLFTIEK